MIRRTVLLITLAAVVGTTVPQRADAGYGCAVGRIASMTANSITVFDKESRTFTVDRRTRYTNWPTQGAWQAIRQIDPQDLYCNSNYLGVGSLVAVHPRHDETNVARWVQVATDQSGSGEGVNACIR
jgi:hypothetical protein